MKIRLEDVTINGFLQKFREIVEEKKSAGIPAIQNNPKDLLERAKSYGTHYKNGSWGWTSNIWSRSAAGSVVVEKDEDLRPEHRELMRSVLEQILCRPLICVDANLGQPDSLARMHCRLYIDPQFPDIAYRWQKLNFPADPKEAPDATAFFIPHYMENPCVPGTQEMLKIIRFPHHDYTIITATSYQGECKKAFLSHWIYHVYKKGGTGEHASLKEFSVRRPDGSNKHIVMSVWGLSGSGKSTHGMYIVNERTSSIFKEKFGIDVAGFVSRQAIKNDDIVGVFEDKVVSPERGAWTKTEDVTEKQIGIWKAARSPHALHENTEWDKNGDVSFKGELFHYHGRPHQNARTVIFFKDTGYFDGSVDSKSPLNMAVFISPGYISDFAWLKINDAAFAAKVLADGRSTGHPAQSRKGVGEERYVSRYCFPFTMGAGNALHVERFYQFIKKRENSDNPIDIYLINTTGRIGAQYDWIEVELQGKKLEVPMVRFEIADGKKRAIGGTCPSIEETELFFFQAARGVVKYRPHPIWGSKVLLPFEVPGIKNERIKELNPFSYRSFDEMKRLLNAQLMISKYYLDIQCSGLPDYIYSAMDL